MLILAYITSYENNKKVENPDLGKKSIHT